MYSWNKMSLSDCNEPFLNARTYNFFLFSILVHFKKIASVHKVRHALLLNRMPAVFSWNNYMFAFQIHIAYTRTVPTRPLWFSHIAAVSVHFLSRKTAIKVVAFIYGKMPSIASNPFVFPSRIWDSFLLITCRRAAVTLLSERWQVTHGRRDAWRWTCQDAEQATLMSFSKQWRAQLRGARSMSNNGH